MQVHEEWPIGLAIHETLSDDVVGLTAERFVGDGLNLEGKAEITEVFERDWRHADLVLFSGDLDHRGAFVGLVEVLDTRDFGELALGGDG